MNPNLPRPIRRFPCLWACLFLTILGAGIAAAQTSTPLVNGGDNTGTITSGGTNAWTFNANAGDTVVLNLASTNFPPQFDLFGPDGARVAEDYNGIDDSVAIQAAQSGVYTVLVSSYNGAGNGSYTLRLAELSQPFAVPPVALTNGGENVGTLELGGLALWSFTANAGDNFALRLATTNFYGALILTGPDGTVLFNNTCCPGQDLSFTPFTATNSGQYTALVEAQDGETGSYVLRLAQIAQPLSVPPVALTNAGANFGWLNLGDVDLWSFTANAGDTFALRLATTNFAGILGIYGPDGTVVYNNACCAGPDDSLTPFTATYSGAYTVLVEAQEGGTGSYALRLAQISQPFSVPPVAMANGGENIGMLNLGDLDLWSFTANTGDNFAVRLATTNFAGILSIYGPDGRVLYNISCCAGPDDSFGPFSATNSGKYTVLVEAQEGGTGSYALRLAQIDQPFSVPPLTIANGGDNLGMLNLGGLDLWSFTASAGDNFALRLATTNFYGFLCLYGPDGTVLFNNSCCDAQDISFGPFAATNGGEYTVLVEGQVGGTGSYALRLAQFSQPFSVPAFLLASGGTNSGILSPAGLDRWAFNACASDEINAQLVTTNFSSSFSLYGPDGSLLSTANGYQGLASVAFEATNCGTFTLLVTSLTASASGDYEFASGVLSPAVKICAPAVTASNVVVTGVGGLSNADAKFILFSAPNLTAPRQIWNPVYTNQFDKGGVFSYTNSIDPTSLQEYFRFRVTP